MAGRPLSILVIALVPALAIAQHTFTAIVQDSLTGEPIAGVNIILVGTNKGAASSSDGTVVIHNVPDGAQRFLLSCVGYERRALTFSFPMASTNPVVVSLFPQPTEEREVIVTSTRLNSRLEETPVKVEVLGVEDLLEENSIKPGNVASILGDFSGVQIQQTSAVSGTSVVRMQGLDGKYTLLARDGMPAFGGLSGGLNILQIPPLDLQQIEIIKGPASTLYGSGAIAGFINFVSKKPSARHEFSVTANQSSLKETNFNAYLSGTYHEVGYTLFVGSTRQRAVDVDGDGFSDVPSVRSYQVHPQTFISLDDHTTLRLGFTGGIEERIGGDIAAVNMASDSTHQYKERTIIGSAALDGWLRQTYADKRELSLKGVANFFDRRSKSAAEALDGHQWNMYTELSYLIPSGDASIILGGNYLFDGFTNNVSDTSGHASYNRATLGFFAQYAWQAEKRYNVHVGLRADYNDANGWFVLPSAAAVAHVHDDFYVRASFGSGYKIPNALDFTGSNGPSGLKFVSGSRYNDSGQVLDAERSYGGTIEWNYQDRFSTTGTFTFNQSFFYTNIDRTAIASVVGSNTVATPQVAIVNATASVTSVGVDHYARLAMAPYELYLGYTYTVPKRAYDALHPYLPLTPMHRAAATLVADASKRWRAGLDVSYVGTQYREDGSTTRDYLFVAGMVQFNAPPFTLVLNGENLFDFRQSTYERIVFPPLTRPTFAPLWAPIDGRVINLSMLVKL